MLYSSNKHSNASLVKILIKNKDNTNYNHITVFVCSGSIHDVLYTRIIICAVQMLFLISVFTVADRTVYSKYF